MLRTRILTALVLFVVLIAVIVSNSFPFFVLIAAVFFSAAMWESLRLFSSKHPLMGVVLWTVTFSFIAFQERLRVSLFFGLCVFIWSVRLAPSLAMGLPQLKGLGNWLLNGVYGIAILGCFVAIVVLFEHSPIYLLSVMAIVWIADIGAYFVGKIFGKHKLAPSISPGKSWEGVIGGWCAVLAISAFTVVYPALNNTFTFRLHAQLGWFGFFVVLTLLVVASIVGDLFESQLKRRIAKKDSSNLLPGHGGVLDRIDALIPVLPLAVLVDSLL